MVSWLDIVTMKPGSSFTQTSAGRHRAQGQDDYRLNPEINKFTLDSVEPWKRLDDVGDVDVRGRLIGGCIDTLCNLAGTPYGDLSAFARLTAAEGLLVYVEAAEHDAGTICRNLHGMRLAGFFAEATAILVGHTRAAALDSLTQHEAVLDALGSLGVPIIADIECGHTVPYMPIVNGAQGRLVSTTDQSRLTQTLA
jgi:muramoyltetrapeptide carboxypeptidase